MRRFRFCPRYTWFYAVGGSEYFLMYRVLRHAQRDEIPVHISEEGGRPTDVEVSLNRNVEFLQAREVPVTLNIEVISAPVSWIWLAVRDD